MKKQVLGRHLIATVGMLIAAFACQPRASNAPGSNKMDNNQNPMQNDNEDEDVDDGAYGDGDTSTLNQVDTGAPAHKVESATDANDIQSAETPSTASVIEPVKETSGPITGNTSTFVEEAREEASPEKVTALEAVHPVEIVAEHQVQHAEQN